MLPAADAGHRDGTGSDLMHLRNYHTVKLSERLRVDTLRLGTKLDYTL